MISVDFTLAYCRLHFEWKGTLVSMEKHLSLFLELGNQSLFYIFSGHVSPKLNNLTWDFALNGHKFSSMKKRFVEPYGQLNNM